MKIIIAPDSFKGCLTSPDVAKFIEMGIRNVLPDANIKLTARQLMEKHLPE
jgi:glycerate kinase